MRLLAIGRQRQSPEAALFRRYAERIRPRLELREFPEAAGSPAEIKRREAGLLLAALHPDERLIALDPEGLAPDSAGLARLLRGWMERGGPCFVIGGAEGLDGSVLSRADAALSLGALTWPHLLARAMLAEQIYRAQMINIGHPYHRAGRPC